MSDQGRVKLVHAADLHIDSPLRGLSAYEGAPLEAIRGATRRAFAQLIDLCLRERAEFLILAGDLYDGEDRDYGTALFLASELGRLRETQTRVVWLRGNHDAESRLTKHLRLGELTHEFRTDIPETHTFEREGVAFHGQGYRVRDTSDNLARRYPAPRPSLLNVGVLHTSLDGREGHAPYAPCKRDDLVSLGYDYFALGHVHAREIVSVDPWIAFPGNLQGRHVRETGPKGALLVQSDGSKVVEANFVELDVVRWAVLDCTRDENEALLDFLDRLSSALEEQMKAASGRLLAVRIRVACRTERQLSELRSSDTLFELRRAANDLGYVYLENLEATIPARTLPLDLAARADALGRLSARILEGPLHEASLLSLREEFSRELASVPADLLRSALDQLPALAREAQELLGELFLSPEGEE